MITLHQVTHHYRIRPVLREVSLNVEKGELVAIMGPNGSGKSTLMSIVAGLTSPLRGYVEIDGKRRRSSAADELDIRRHVFFLPADPWVPPGITGREWLQSVGRIYEIEDDRLMDHVERLLTLFDLSRQGDSSVSAYSTGQKKKIAVCGALVSEAGVLLMDEPFAGGLDPSGILALKRVLQHHTKLRDRTVLMATPVPEVVEELADRVAIMRDGRIAACDSVPNLRRLSGASGPMDEVYERLVNPRNVSNLEQYFQGGRT